MAGNQASIQSQLRQEGYSKEEEYFYEANKELIERRRVELDETREKRREERLKAVHWMKCPKCGHEMKEFTLSGIFLDQCTQCKGIYFDQGELDTLLNTRAQKSFLDALWKWLRKDK